MKKCHYNNQQNTMADSKSGKEGQKSYKKHNTVNKWR